MSLGLLIFFALWFLLEFYLFRFLVKTIYGPVGNGSGKELFVSNFGFTILYWTIPVLLLLNWSAQVGGLIHYSDISIWIYVNAVFFVMYITKLFLLLFAVIADAFLIFGRGWKLFSGKDVFDPGRKQFLRNSATLVGLIPLPTLLYGMVRNPYRYRLHEVDVVIKDLPKGLEGLKVVQISDMHAGSWFFREPVERSVEMINEQQADIVVFTGDMVNNKADEMEPFIDLFSKVKSRYGVYSVLGNHDYGDYYRWSGQREKEENFVRLLEIQREMKWELLRNENKVLNINGSALAIVGVENYSALPQFPRYGDLDKAVENLDPGILKILLSHDPTHWDAEIVGKRWDIPLMLSGHTHGFQFGFEIPGFARWSPSSMIYNQWAGLYRKGQQYLYVNRGLGYLGYPGRVGILPEITSLVLKRT
ncbi:MAG: metallophosphoesterase [Saprospirales bacterium]|nr:MAG: metallophosphoesterase [Saprospirales bacterium]